MIKTLSLITLAEILRDFIQYIYIVVQGLGSHISNPTRLTFIQITNWLSLDLYKTITIRMSFTMFAQLLLLIFCSSYLFALTLQQIKRNIQGLDGQTYAEIGSFMKFCNLITIFIITTLFQPMINNSLFVWFNQIDGNITKEEEFIMKILSVCSLLFIVIIIPIIFIKGIISCRPEKNKYDKNGGQLMNSREIYSEYLQKTQSPFKPIFRDYCYSGAYFKLIIMLYKFAQLVIMFEQPNPQSGLIQFIIKYSLFAFLSILLFIYIYRVRPYLNNRLNSLYFVSIIATLWSLGCNVGVFYVQDNNQASYSLQILQLVGCLLIFFFQFFSIILMSLPSLQRAIEKMKSQLRFTQIKERGFKESNIVGLKQNKYLKYIMFNQNIYNKQSEICISIWQDFWKKLITSDNRFKSNVKLNNLIFVNQRNATPYLKNFGGKVEERFEENTRILQKIGKSVYLDELNRLENPEYKKLILFIFRDINPLDSYYSSEEKQVKGFCKVTFFPFPMMLLLSFDSFEKQLELKGYDDLHDFYIQNMSEDIVQLRLKRTKLRALNGHIVDYSHMKRLAIKQGQESDIKDISKSIDMEISYTFGKFIVQTDMVTKFKVPNGPFIDVGKGFRCHLMFKKGIAQGIDGRVYKAPPLNLQNEELQLELLHDENSIINQIIEQNQDIWQNEVRKIQDYIDRYKMSMVGDFLLKQKVLTYSFNFHIFLAPYCNIINKELIFKELKKEMNFELEILPEKDKYIFIYLYEVLSQCDKSDYFAYLYLLFKDIWSGNQDMAIIVKNEDLLNPDLATCIIYQVDKNLQDWKEIFFNRGLRTNEGRGYFNDKIINNINAMLKNFNDTPKEVLLHSFIMQEQDMQEKNSSSQEHQLNAAQQPLSEKADQPSIEQKVEQSSLGKVAEQVVHSNCINCQSKERNQVNLSSVNHLKSIQNISDHSNQNNNSVISYIHPINHQTTNNQMIEEIDSKFDSLKAGNSSNDSTHKNFCVVQIEPKEDNIFIKKQPKENFHEYKLESTQIPILSDISNKNIPERKKSYQFNSQQSHKLLNSGQNSFSSNSKEMGTQTKVQIFHNDDLKPQKFKLNSLLNKSKSSHENNYTDIKTRQKIFNSDLTLDTNKQTLPDRYLKNNISFNDQSDKQFIEKNVENKHYQDVDDILENKQIETKF